jgi:hypothetical protein
MLPTDARRAVRVGEGGAADGGGEVELAAAAAAALAAVSRGCRSHHLHAIVRAMLRPG